MIFNNEQMKQVNLGLEKGINIDVYKKLNMTIYRWQR